MKRIHLLEKEHETMEKTGTDIQLFYIDKESKNNEQEALDELSPTDKVQQINFRSDCDSNQLENANSEREVKAEKFPEDNYGTKNAENCANLDLEKGDERTLKSNEKNGKTPEIPSC